MHGVTGEVGEIGKFGSFILKLEGFSTAALSWTPSCWSSGDVDQKLASCFLSTKKTRKHQVFLCNFDFQHCSDIVVDTNSLGETCINNIYIYKQYKSTKKCVLFFFSICTPFVAASVATYYVSMSGLCQQRSMIPRLASGTTLPASSGFATHHGVPTHQIRTKWEQSLANPLKFAKFCEACKLSLHLVWHVLAWICMVGMGGLLFSYGGFDHKNPRGSQLWGETLDSKPADSLVVTQLSVLWCRFRTFPTADLQAKHGEAWWSCLRWMVLVKL